MSITLQDIANYVDKLQSLVNTEGAVYDELAALVNDQPLDTITDAQIRAYFNDLLSDKAVVIIRQALVVMEEQMPRDRVNLTDFDVSELKKLG